MRTQITLMLIIAGALCLQGPVARASEPTAAGLWEQVDQAGKPDAWFLISEQNGTYRARLVKLFTKPGANPNPLCTQCPRHRKNAPWLGLTVVEGMEQDGLNYQGGTILDPRNGSEYLGQMQLSPDGQTLTVRGDLGIDPLGGNEAWRRLPMSALKTLDHSTTADADATSHKAGDRTTSRKPRGNQ